ncbi:hypothetical protein K505DRAFT_323859 [Melanomma pulvis-pyrius CBS 109.77]|uniref:Uncharacterized protein n=1 Tax=Melanomma pulvis-pyrius CBS 109.77 TaxID=1314802 RepID=A0A6A6XGM1_9PLEO|nr:hypothetical protein K505DRAFT_323859 [Melanomma pulvis-pyrius CBS 109.77]
MWIHANDTLAARLTRAQPNVAIAAHNTTYWVSRCATAAAPLISVDHSLGFSMAFPPSLKDRWVEEAMDALLAGDDESFKMYDDLASAVEVVAVQAQKLDALVLFNTSTAASRVRASLHGSIWPAEGNRKELWVNFVPEDSVESWIQSEEDAMNAERRRRPRWRSGRRRAALHGRWWRGWTWQR